MKIDFKILIIIILFVLLLLSFKTCKTYKDKSNIYKNNIEALNDTIHKAELKNGEMLYYISNLIVSHKELKDSIILSKKQIKELENKIGKLQSQARVETIIKLDTLKIYSEVNNINNLYNISFVDSSKYHKIKGFSELDISTDTALTTITDNILYVDLTLGLSEDNQFYVISDNPYLQINNIKSLVVREKPKRLSVGVGAGLGCYYGIVSKKIDIGPGIFLGVSYRIF